MLINGWRGSGCNCFPFFFKQSKLGPLIGQRTWGGLIGITVFFFIVTATTEIYTLSLHDALPIWGSTTSGSSSPDVAPRYRVTRSSDSSPAGTASASTAPTVPTPPTCSATPTA